MNQSDPSSPPAWLDALDRTHTRGLLQRTGLLDEPLAPLRSDTREVGQLLTDPDFGAGLVELADRLGRPVGDVRAEATAQLRQMAATHSERASRAWRGFGDWMGRAYDVYVDDDALARLRELDRRSSLIFLFSHRSYLDGTVVPGVVSRSVAAPYTFAGANLNIFPMGAWLSHAGGIFIRRDTAEAPVYRWALRSYIRQLVRNRANLAWSIEGGRTRTGKLRPPVHGILRYVVDAVDADADSVVLVPVSVVYDQLAEVPRMTDEARGGRKRPEDLRWVIQFAREQRTRLGRAYMDIGEPMDLAQRLAELRGDGTSAYVERIALDVCHRINRATPVTTTAVVSLAMLGADRALSLSEVLATVAPLAGYLAGRHWPVAGAADLSDRSTIRRALQDLVRSGVLTAYSGGVETVWGIAPGQHLVAAFYRNTLIHVLVERAIGELALLAAAESERDPGLAVRVEAMRLRELLKFDFFFSSREEFGDELEAELRRFDPGGEAKASFDPGDLRHRLERSRPHVAHLVLRPYLDAYCVVADRLAACDEDEFDEPRFLDECLRVGKQWVLQRRIASDESVTLELFRTGLRLARHEGLVEAEDPSEVDLGKRRRDFADEIRTIAQRTAVLAELAREDAGDYRG